MELCLPSRHSEIGHVGKPVYGYANVARHHGVKPLCCVQTEDGVSVWRISVHHMLVLKRPRLSRVKPSTGRVHKLVSAPASRTPDKTSGALERTVNDRLQKQSQPLQHLRDIPDHNSRRRRDSQPSDFIRSRAKEKSHKHTFRDLCDTWRVHRHDG